MVHSQGCHGTHLVAPPTCSPAPEPQSSISQHLGAAILDFERFREIQEMFAWLTQEEQATGASRASYVWEPLA